MKYPVLSVVATLFVVICATSAEASSGSIGAYNLILLEDYDFNGGDVEGKSIIGGNLNAAGKAVEFGSRLPDTNSAIDAVTIVGDINANHVTIQNGNNIVYGSNSSHANFNLNGSGGSALQRSQTELESEIAAVFTDIYNDSLYFNSLATNGSFSGPGNQSSLSFSGSESVAVFNVNASDVFAQNNSLSLQQASASTVVINVAGTDITAGGGVNLTNGFSQQTATNIVWNFFEATTINFNNLALKGSVLAPYADTTGGSSFDGAFAAVSYTGAREFHNFLFDYDTPKPTPPTTQVNAPASLALFALGLGLVFRTRRNRQRS
ncbi:hypothetical protein Patl_2837 [Paraglaciecola sp. T6c]|uniref:choice-of-anchor A family protein n=1 Tax=Pseudoalteromonas atlantica (strain T6c / ATCC BAA-1087) TaxID=3042615 RepID=UPI00005C6665|nr:choice-of-anchor A family protein [Paraglaciecola sp. T6c]ABG41347.1 hypothetical protein Patl_2837 [Paraglaciecola sp. T6c]